MKLSIITINLNNADGLRKTIESVVSQTFNDYEYIVIDGASTDNSINIIKEYEDKITYWVSEPDAGIYNAMNKGILQAKGEYCLFLNSGDWLLDSSILEKCFGLSFDEDIVWGNLKNRNYSHMHNLRFSMLVEGHLPHAAMFFKKELFDKYGMYDENNKIVSDWKYYVLAIFKYNCTYRYIPIDLAIIDLTGISNDFRNWGIRCAERDKTLKEHFPYFFEDYKNFISWEQELSFLKKSKMIKVIIFVRKKLLLIKTILYKYKKFIFRN